MRIFIFLFIFKLYAGNCESSSVKSQKTDESYKERSSKADESYEKEYPLSCNSNQVNSLIYKQANNIQMDDRSTSLVGLMVSQTDIDSRSIAKQTDMGDCYSRCKIFSHIYYTEEVYGSKYLYRYLFFGDSEIFNKIENCLSNILQYQLVDQNQICYLYQDVNNHICIYKERVSYYEAKERNLPFLPNINELTCEYMLRNLEFSKFILFLFIENKDNSKLKSNMDSFNVFLIKILNDKHSKYQFFSKISSIYNYLYSFISIKERNMKYSNRVLCDLLKLLLNELTVKYKKLSSDHLD